MSQKQLKALTDDGVHFSLFAPRVHQVAIQGSWNDFESTPMAQDTRGIWWVSFPLEDGEYQYRFEVTRQAGEEAVLVADPVGIRFGVDTYDHSIVTVFNGKPVYLLTEWQHDEVELPPNEKLIIYEMQIWDFRGGPGDDPQPGNFKRVIEKLDYLSELGITAIELMPVTEANPDDNWGYSQHSLYGVDHDYGTPDELAQLIDECHKRGIRVIHDGVYNHLHDDAPLTRIDYAYWFYEVNPDPPELHFGPKFNYEFHDDDLDLFPAREHTLSAIKQWISTFHMDGIRFDSTRALKDFEVIRWFTEEAHNRSGYKPFFTIAEHLPQDAAITEPQGPVDAAWHDNFYRQLNCTVLGIPYEDHEPFDTTEVLRVLNARNDGFESNYNIIHYLTNHDMERTMYLLQSKSQLPEEAAFRRNKLGASLLLTAPGIPMLWMGEEFGQANERGEHTEVKPLDWSLLQRDANRDLWEHYRRLIALRKENSALISDYFEPLADLPERGIIAFKRWDDQGNIAIVVANLRDDAAGDVQIPLNGIDDGAWREVLHDQEITVNQQCLETSLAESEVKIYLKL